MEEMTVNFNLVSYYFKIYDLVRDQKDKFKDGLMIYDFARDQKDKFEDGLDIYKLIEKNELVVRRSRGSSAELGPGCPSCLGRPEAEHAADAAMHGRGVADRSAPHVLRGRACRLLAAPWRPGALRRGTVSGGRGCACLLKLASSAARP
jgi:hypothetical protein